MNGDSSALFSTPLIISEEKKNCLAKVVKIFNDLENNPQQDEQVSNVLQLHNDLSSQLSPKEEDITIQQSISRYFSHLRLGEISDTKSPTEKERAESWKKQLFEYLAIEADLYRATALTSMYLMKKIPGTLLEIIQEDLRSCVQRSQLLLKIIDQRVQSAMDPNQVEMEMNSLLQHYNTEYYEQLEALLVEYDASEGDDDNNIIDFDKEQLLEEEEELLHMAATPTPHEVDSSIPPIQGIELSARLIQDGAASADVDHDSTGKKSNRSPQYSTLVVFDEHQGVFRSEHPQEQAWWWLLTSESSVVENEGSNNQTIVISSVLSNRPRLAVSSIQLQIKAPQEFSLWWSRISKFAQTLQQSKDLQTEVTSLWPTSEVEAKLQQARTIISAN